MLYKSYPKINLYLHIIGTTERGYHLLQSRFVLVKGSLYDAITISPHKKPRDSIEGNLPCRAEDSSIARALNALRSVAGVSFPPVRIEVQKRIPSGAGLGGGSSNAGVVLAALIARYGEGFTGCGRELFSYFTQDLTQNSSRTLPQALSLLAQAIGADVAFFLSRAQSAEVRGIGEEIHPCAEHLCDLQHFHIHTPQIHCDTARVYAQYAATSKPKKPQNLSNKSHAEILQSGNPYALNDLLLPACALYPRLQDVAKELGEGWYFSGSGSSFFRPESRAESKQAFQRGCAGASQAESVDSKRALRADSQADSRGDSALDSPLDSRAQARRGYEAHRQK